jgi:hypothetical protein
MLKLLYHSFYLCKLFNNWFLQYNGHIATQFLKSISFCDKALYSHIMSKGFMSRSTFDFIAGILGSFTNKVVQMHALYFFVAILINLSSH